MRQDQVIQYTLLSIRCLIHSDRMRTDSIHDTSPILPCSVIVVLPFLIKGVAQDRICILDYNENSTTQYIHLQTSCNTH